MECSRIEGHRCIAPVVVRSRLPSAQRVDAADDFRDADGLTVPSFGQAQALARIWLEVKRSELAGHPEPVRGTLR